MKNKIIMFAKTEWDADNAVLDKQRFQPGKQ